MSDMDNAIAAMAADAGDERVSDATQEPMNAPDGAPETPEVTETPDAPAVPEDAPDAPETPPADVPTDTPAPVAPPATDDTDDSSDTPPADAPDFTLDVTDAEGTTYKISSIEDLPEDFEPANNRQIIEILRDLGRVESERTAYEADQQADQEAEARQQEVAAIQETWNQEIAALQGDKRIPVTADGSESPRVKEVFAYLQEENAKRIEANRPTIRSFEDALDKLENKEAREAAVAAAKTAKTTARQNGALVGGNSAPGGAPPASYRAGSARNIQEAIRQSGLL